MKVISGFQSGADRAGLDVALALNLEVGGTVPKGRLTEDGAISDADMARYNLTESDSPGYPERTRANVKASDGTVIFGRETSPGSRLTINTCKFYRRPYLINPSAAMLRQWIAEHEIETLNVAGNRESGNPGIYMRTFGTVMEALAA